MWFIKIKYRHDRVYKVLRTRTTLTSILLFVTSLPFRSWRNIEKLKIERIEK